MRIGQSNLPMRYFTTW